MQRVSTAIRTETRAIRVAIGGAFLALAIGLMVYATDRDAARVALMPAALALPIGPLFGTLGHWLPAFVHPFAFSLLWAATRRADASPAYGACAGWWAVVVAFETGQHPDLSLALSQALRACLGDGRIGHLFAGYFVHGTFDPADIVAATAGALAAAALLTLAGRKRGSRHAH